MMTDKVTKINTKFIVISVVVLTILTLSVSYSAFFDVKVQQNVQSFQAGTLNVNITNSNPITTGTELSIVPTTNLPKASNTEAPSTGYTTINLENKGTVDAAFLVTLIYDESGDALAKSKLNIGVYEEGKGWVQFNTTSPSYYVSLNQLQASEANNYPLLRGTVSDTTKKYRIYVWLSENAEITDIHKNVKISLKVKSIPAQGQDDTNALGNVTVSG